MCPACVPAPFGEKSPLAPRNAPRLSPLPPGRLARTVPQLAREAPRTSCKRARRHTLTSPCIPEPTRTSPRDRPHQGRGSYFGFRNFPKSHRRESAESAAPARLAANPIPQPARLESASEFAAHPPWSNLVVGKARADPATYPATVQPTLLRIVQIGPHGARKGARTASPILSKSVRIGPAIGPGSLPDAEFLTPKFCPNRPGN